MQKRGAEPSRVRPVVLVTGFGPFPGVPRNVSSGVAEAVVRAAADAIPQARFESAALPVDWTRAPTMLAELCERLRPDVSVHFGVTADASGFRLERCAANSCLLSHDAAGCLPVSDTLSELGPTQRRAALPLDIIAARLTAMGLPVSISEDAGTYLCNALFFHALDGDSPCAPRHAAFVHIPCDLSGPPLDFPSAVLGGVEIVRCALEAVTASNAAGDGPAA